MSVSPSGNCSTVTVNDDGSAVVASCGAVINQSGGTVADGSVTYAKIQNTAAGRRLIGRPESTAGTVSEVSLGTGLKFSGSSIVTDAVVSDGTQVLAGTGLTGGGALSGNVTLSANFGTAAGTVCQGNDTRLTSSVLKAGDTMTGTLTSTIGSVTSARSITATGTSTATSGLPILASWTHTLAPASNSTAQGFAFYFENVLDTASGITYGNSYAFSSYGMRWGANADGAVSAVRAANIVGAYLNSSSVAATGVLANCVGIFAQSLTRFSGSSTGTVTNAFGIDIQAVGNAAYTITNLTGLRVQTGGSGNTVTNAIGVDINAQTLGSTTNVGLRVAAASGGSTTAAIQLTGTTGAASGILFSTDTNLYRSAANTLKTDDTFEAANVSGTNTGDQNVFQTIAVSGQSNVVADSTTDTLTLAAGSGITITTDASTDTITIASTAAAFNPATKSESFTDFLGDTTAPWANSGAGTGSTITYGVAGNSDHPGVAEVATGTASTGRRFVGSSQVDELVFGTRSHTFSTSVTVPNLSDATDTYTVYAGFFDLLTGTPTNGAYFRYSHGVNGGDWECVTANASTETTTDSNVAVTASTWNRLEVEVNAAGTSVVFKIDGNTVATHTTNIPTAGVGVGCNIRKSAGTTSRTVQMDYLYHSSAVVR